MNGILILIPVALIALVIGLGIGYVIKQNLVDRAHEKTKAAGQQLLDEANKRAKDIELGAKNQALEIREEAETEVARRRNELSRDEEKLHRRRDELDSRSERLERREQTLNKRQSTIDKRGNEIDKLHDQQ